MSRCASVAGSGSTSGAAGFCVTGVAAQAERTRAAKRGIAFLMGRHSSRPGLPQTSETFVQRDAPIAMNAKPALLSLAAIAAAASTIAIAQSDNATRGLQAFEVVRSVLQHPRCAN